ncbi:hypothetical protein E2C01_037997 [Portunus trituberculatus]|uniref:Uncharacterized protein n=1 Tax=Portunus trituberculatus TaxID=210409 RepID=A0A5B7FFK8_PORTR|nr:hypothetical protein [Portunus trituberculatus]
MVEGGGSSRCFLPGDGVHPALPPSTTRRSRNSFRADTKRHKGRVNAVKGKKKGSVTRSEIDTVARYIRCPYAARERRVFIPRVSLTYAQGTYSPCLGRAGTGGAAAIMYYGAFSVNIKETEEKAKEAQEEDKRELEKDERESGSGVV